MRSRARSKALAALKAIDVLKEQGFAGLKKAPKVLKALQGTQQSSLGAQSARRPKRAGNLRLRRSAESAQSALGGRSKVLEARKALDVTKEQEFSGLEKKALQGPQQSARGAPSTQQSTQQTP
jgi:hypothetical protein